MADEGFMMTADVALIFFRTCKLYHIEGEKERTEILRKLVARKKAKYVARPKELLKNRRILQIRKDDTNGLPAND